MVDLRRFSRIEIVRIDRRQKRAKGMGISCHLQSGVTKHTLGPEHVNTLGSPGITISHYKLRSRINEMQSFMSGPILVIG